MGKVVDEFSGTVKRIGGFVDGVFNDLYDTLDEYINSLWE